MLELIYQLVKPAVLSNITLEKHKEFWNLVERDESPKKFRQLSPSDILQRWTSYHLHNQTTNINKTALRTVELRTLFISLLGSLPENEAWFVNSVARLGIELPFLDEKVAQSGNCQLQILFLAQLAHARPGVRSTESDSAHYNLTRPEEEEKDFDPEGTREERTFVTWINGLGIPTWVTNLQSDMNDGLVLLNVLDKIDRGCINWRDANSTPTNAYKKLENCNLGVRICVGNRMNFSLVGVAGKDIYDGVFLSSFLRGANMYIRKPKVDFGSNMASMQASSPGCTAGVWKRSRSDRIRRSSILEQKNSRPSNIF